MSATARRSENDKLQAIMNALLMPVPGEPATGTKRFREAKPDKSVPQTERVAAPAAFVPAPVHVHAVVQRSPEFSGQEVPQAAAVLTGGQRRSLFVAPVELAEAPVAPVVPVEIATAARQKGPLFAAPLQAAAGAKPSLADLISAVDRRAAPAILARAAKATAAAYAEVVSEIMAAVLELTVVEPMRDAMASFETAAGEVSRKTTQRGRAGKMPKVGRATKTAKTSMAMAMRDARRLSLKIAAARAETATKHDIDFLRDELLSTRRRCHSPAYAKALREALPIVLPTIVPFMPSAPRRSDTDAAPPAPPVMRQESAARVPALPERIVIVPPSAAARVAAPAAISQATAGRKATGWSRALAAAGMLFAGSLAPSQQAMLVTAEAELIAPPAVMTGSL